MASARAQVKEDRRESPETRSTREALHRLIDQVPEQDLGLVTERLDEILARSDPRDQSLIERWIRPHPDRTGPADALLAGTQVPVYAVVGQVKTSGGDLDDAADAYEISREAVEAAIAHYRRHRAAIDARMFTGI